MEAKPPQHIESLRSRFAVNDAQAGPRLSGVPLLPKLHPTQQFPNPLKVGSSIMWPPPWGGTDEMEPPNGLNMSSSHIHNPDHYKPPEPSPPGLIHSEAVDSTLKRAIRTHLPWPHECVLRNTPIACRIRNNRKAAHQDLNQDGRLSEDEKEIFARGSLRRCFRVSPPITIYGHITLDSTPYLAEVLWPVGRLPIIRGRFSA